jgi:hypothetical protein
MQPMGRPKHALKVPCFFPFMFWVGWLVGGGGGGRGFFFFFHFSQLPNVFALCSFQVPNGFPIFSPTFFRYLLTFICLGKWCPPFTYIGGPKGRNCTVQNRAFCFGEFSLLLLLFWSDGLIKLARWAPPPPKKKKTGEAPHLINRRGDYFHKFISLPLA